MGEAHEGDPHGVRGDRCPVGLDLPLGKSDSLRNAALDAFNFDRFHKVVDHFHGNFWWSHSKYISRLSEIQLSSDYIEGEMWVNRGNPNVCEFFSTGLNHYLDNRFTLFNLISMPTLSLALLFLPP